MAILTSRQSPESALGVGTAMLFLVLCLGLMAPPVNGQVTEQNLTVDLSSDAGPISHKASGWLYGQSEPGIPTVSMMAPLRPQTSAQKPPDGLQHPNGDALQVGSDYKKAGGKEIQLYMQDIYPDWPYNHPGIDDYVEKVRIIVKKTVADPNHELFSYVPFNEPDNNWYGYSGVPLQKLLRDWKTVYLAIRALDPNAKIVGPGFYNYRRETYRQFLRYVRDNQVLPQEISWHELQDNSFSGFDDRYLDYRELETSLGIAPIPIVINEYTRANGDLGLPGKLVPWISRLENRKVLACLAFWTPSGTLADLVARTWPNRATGGWWVYKWYGGMTGETVSVIPPDTYGFGLQGVATLDPTKRQARIIFGNAAGTVKVKIKGFNHAPFFGSDVHVYVWRVDSSGIEPSSGPILQQETEYAVSSDEITVEVNGAIETSAYHLIVTPATSAAPSVAVNHYKAEFSDLSGGATISYGKSPGRPSTGYVKGFDAHSKAAVEFAVTAPDDGYYDLGLSYSFDPAGDIAKHTKIALYLNGSPMAILDLTKTTNGKSWPTLPRKVFLAGGINLISYAALPDGSSSPVRIDSLDVSPASGLLTTYEAASKGTMLGGAVKIEVTSETPVRKFATLIGAAKENFLQFNNVSVSASGSYKMIVTYSNSEKGHAGQVERYADISVNDGPTKRVYFRNTFDKSVFRSSVVEMELIKGANTVRFSNTDQFAPDIEKIQIANP